jgi:hypothetical protein
MSEGQATQSPREKNRRTSNTMAKRKGQMDKQHNGQKKMIEGQAIQCCVACPSVPFLWPFCCLSFCPCSFGHCVACPSVSFVLAIEEKGQKDKQHNHQKKRDRRASNTMVKRK